MAHLDRALSMAHSLYLWAIGCGGGARQAPYLHTSYKPLIKQ